MQANKPHKLFERGRTFPTTVVIHCGTFTCKHCKVQRFIQWEVGVSNNNRMNTERIAYIFTAMNNEWTFLQCYRIQFKCICRDLLFRVQEQTCEEYWFIV